LGKNGRGASQKARRKEQEGGRNFHGSK